MVREGTFREDLFYRLSVVPLWVPPLRERREDIETLCRYFVKLFGQSNGRSGANFTPEALRVLSRHDWPGNVRQLQNIVERLVLLSEADSITEDEVLKQVVGVAPAALSATGARVVGEERTGLEATRRDAEAVALRSALDKTKNNRTQAARLLGVSRRTLYNKLEEHGLL